MGRFQHKNPMTIYRTTLDMSVMIGSLVKKFAQILAWLGNNSYEVLWLAEYRSRDSRSLLVQLSVHETILCVARLWITMHAPKTLASLRKTIFLLTSSFLFTRFVNGWHDS